MSNSVESNVATFQATNAAIAAYRIVDVDTDGKISLASSSASEIQLGVTDAAIAANEFGSVRLFNRGGIVEVELGDTVATLQTALGAIANGKAGVTFAGATLLRNLQAGVSGDIVKCLVVN
jgi:hypothetical protein